MKTFFVRLSFIATIATVSACSSKVQFQSAPSTLAAQPKVEVRKTSNGNSEITLKIRHLTPPEKVAPGSTTYVVWARATEPEGIAMTNVGALRPNDDLEATFKTVTPFRKLVLSLTAEREQTVSLPTTPAVLWTEEISVD